MDWEDTQSPMCDVSGSNMGTGSLGCVLCNVVDWYDLGERLIK